jgi:hypothetical protein
LPELAYLQVKSIIETWGKRCNGYLAVSNHTDVQQNTLHLRRRGPEDFHNIWQKIRAIVMMLDSLNNQPDAANSADFEWAFISGDDTYLFVESLRHMLDKIAENYDSSVPVILGQVLTGYNMLIIVELTTNIYT